MAEIRDVRITLRDRQTTGGSLPVDTIFGEPFVNLFDGVLRFSGVTGGGFETSSQSGVFEVGSTLYNQKITNRLNVNNNFIISGDTGLISTYNGLTGAALSGKFLSGTTAGFVVANISDIQGVQTLVQNGTNTTTGGTSAFPTVNVVASPSFNNVLFSGSAIGGNVQAAAGTFTSLSATTLSGGTILSGGTDLYSIFLTAADVSATTITAGSNVVVSNVGLNYTVSVSGSPSFNNVLFSGSAIGGNVQAAAGTFTSLSATTLSGGTILSGGTNLYNIFQKIGDVDGVENVNAGSNITTGGTATSPIINLAASPSVNNITFSGSAIGGNVQAAAGTFTSLTATTLSANTIYSAGTDLYNIFVTTDTNDITRVQPGVNTTTGGTDNFPTVNIVASPSFNNVLFSGSAIGGNVQAAAGTFTSLSATTLSGGTIYSGSTNLQNTFNTINSQLATKANLSGATFTGAISAPGVSDSTLTSGWAVYAGASGALKTNSGFTYDDVANQLFAQNIQIGSASLSGNVTIWGDVTVMGQSISAFTSQLYIEDNNIILNYNPTANTTSTSLGAGLTIQDGSGIAGTDVFWDIRGTATTVDERSFSTNLNDIRIRETGSISSPNGVRVLAELDILDGGSY